MRKNITRRQRRLKEVTKAVLFTMLMIVGIMIWVLTANADTGLFMDVTVTSTNGNGSVVFMNEDGHSFEFARVTHPFKVGDETALEVIATYDHTTNSFKVINMFYLIPDKEKKGGD